MAMILLLLSIALFKFLLRIDSSEDDSLPHVSYVFNFVFLLRDAVELSLDDSESECSVIADLLSNLVLVVFVDCSNFMKFCK